MAGDTPTRRERKKSQTRQVLLDAALTQFDERGFAATTIEDIAAQADVAPRTFFRYFPDKASVLRPATDVYLATFDNLLATAPKSDPLLVTIHQSLRGTLLTFHDERDRIVRQHRIATEAGLDKPAEEFGNLWAAFETSIANFLGTTPGDDLRPALITGLAVGIAAASMQQWLHGGATADLGALVDEAFATLEGLVSDGVKVASGMETALVDEAESIGE